MMQPEVELENAQKLSTADLRTAYEKIYANGVLLVEVEAIWFQRDKNFIDLEMRDGSRQVIEEVW